MKRRKIQLAASFLGANLSRLGEEMEAVEREGADRIHIDVMDGHFVPHIAGGVSLIRWLRQATRLSIEAHLMVLDPDLLIDEFVDAGADSILIHWEGNNNLSRSVQRVKVLGTQVGIALNPATPVSVLEEILSEVDNLLLLTDTQAGGRAAFLRSTLPKINAARLLIDEINPNCDVSVEGGVDATTAPLAVDAGANVLVVGSAIFNQGEGVAAGIKRMRESVNLGVEKQRPRKTPRRKPARS